MEESQPRTYSVGELARKFGITIRTIQYYDKEGLLNAAISPSGRRVLSSEDVLRLQQILFFKSFGFPLEEIRDRLLKVNYGTELKTILEQQKIALLGKMNSLQNALRMMDKTIEEMDNGYEVNINRLIAMMSLINQGNSCTFILNYLGNDQISEIMMKFRDPDTTARFSRANEEIVKKLKELHRQNVLPESEEGQRLAEQWWSMVTEFTEGDPEMLTHLLSAGLDVENWPDEVEDFKEAVTNFLMSALNLYLGKKGIKLTRRQENPQ